MSRWVPFDEVIESTADRLTAGEEDQRSRIYRYSDAHFCMACPEDAPGFATLAELQRHRELSHRLAGWDAYRASRRRS